MYTGRCKKEKKNAPRTALLLVDALEIANM
jgi:hypothetical protein